MKELTIEEKAKAYDKAVERAIAWRKKYDNFISEDGTMIQDFYNIFPDLKESEDDRIMRAIVRFIQMEVEDEKVGNKWIAWLKKKCQVKDSTISQHENKTCKENEDSLTSEDERIIHWIRKELESKYVVDNIVNSLMADKAFAWLEKQGEHANFLSKIQVGDKVTRNEDGVLINLSRKNRVAKKCEQILANSAKTCKDEQKTPDKVEPKFKVGDWVVHNNTNFIFQVVSIGSYGYEVINRENHKRIISSDYKDKYHLWTIQDAKDGDILYSQKGAGVECVHLIHGWEKIQLTGNTLYSMCTYRMEDNEIVAGGIGAVWWEGVKDKFTPATKEQRDLLFKKMHEAGYEWDAEKKELKKIDQNFILNEVQPKQITPEEPAWSEEDEINRDLVYNALNQVYDMAQNKNLSAWINRIIFRYTWKPSKEQMKALLSKLPVIKGGGDKVQDILDSLYDDLKKLMDR